MDNDLIEVTVLTTELGGDGRVRWFPSSGLIRISQVALATEDHNAEMGSYVRCIMKSGDVVYLKGDLKAIMGDRE